MSFTNLLADAGDEQLTLEAALALIERCDSDEVEFLSGSSSVEPASPVPTELVARDASADSAATSSPVSSSSGPNVSAKPLAKRARASRSKRKPGASTEQQRRKKQEIQSLREQAGELEERLRQHKRRKQEETSVWMELAVLQCRQRQRAELTNRKLKEIWGSQSRLHDAIKHLVGKRSALAGRELVFREPVLYDTPPSVRVDSNVMAELERSMHDMYLESDVVFRPANVDAPRSSVASVSYQTGFGLVVDFVTASLMPCSISQASVAVWQQSNANMKIPDKTFKITLPDENSSEKTMSWTLRDGNRRVRLNGWQFMRKFDEPHRTVVARASLLVLGSSSLKLRDRTWIVVTPSPGSPTQQSVVRYCYRLYVESESGASFNSSDLNSLRQLVSTNVVACMGAHVDMVRQAAEHCAAHATATV